MDVSRRDQIRSTTYDVGARIRAARAFRRCSQEALGASLDVTFQQVQKYENGTNRVSVATLLAIAEELRIDVGFFLPPGSVPAGQIEIDQARADLAAAKAAIADAIAMLRQQHGRIEAAEARLAPMAPRTALPQPQLA